MKEFIQKENLEKLIEAYKPILEKGNELLREISKCEQTRKGFSVGVKILTYKITLYEQLLELVNKLDPKTSPVWEEYNTQVGKLESECNPLFFKLYNVTQPEKFSEACTILRDHLSNNLKNSVDSHTANEKLEKEWAIKEREAKRTKECFFKKHNISAGPPANEQINKSSLTPHQISLIDDYLRTMKVRKELGRLGNLLCQKGILWENKRDNARWFLNHFKDNPCLKSKDGKPLTAKSLGKILGDFLDEKTNPDEVTGDFQEKERYCNFYNNLFISK